MTLDLIPENSNHEDDKLEEAIESSRIVYRLVCIAIIILIISFTGIFSSSTLIVSLIFYFMMLSGSIIMIIALYKGLMLAGILSELSKEEMKKFRKIYFTKILLFRK